MSIVRQIEEKRAEVELEVKYQSSLLSPIRKLPDELLSEIMLYSSRRRVDVCSPRSDAWKLERVCKRWRNVALSVQELWSNIEVYLGSLSSYKAAVPMGIVKELVDRCLQRSENHSLSIKFIEIGSPPHFLGIFDHLSRASHRWQDISFSLSMLSEAPQLDNGLTRLRSLGLSGAYKATRSLSSFQHAQQLTQLRLFSVVKPCRTLILPWSQLTYLKIIYCVFQTGEFMEMLHRTPNLVEFISKGNKGLTKNHLDSVRPIYDRSLQCLEIQASPMEICTLFQPITFPKLSELYITHLTQTTQNLHIQTADSITSAIRRSNCFITTLTLSSAGSKFVSRILEETPHLKCLTLEYIDDIEAVLHDLSRPHRLVPVLVFFALTCKVNQGMVSVLPLVEMVRARTSTKTILSSGCFRSLNLTLKEERGVEQLTRYLRPLSEQYGVGVVVHSLPF
jgi:hypothetical protein